MNAVFLLGAGFSKAISSRMPVLSELSAQVYSGLSHIWRDEWGPDLAANVELLLTHLASVHPWESESQRHEALGYYHQVKEAMAQWISDAETDVTLSSSHPPAWLLDLCSYWHRQCSYVVTFNYDCLIEYAVPHADMDPYEVAGGTLYDVPIPAAKSRAHLVFGFERHATFRLLKLHGSLNWWYSGPGSPPGDIVYGTGLARGWGTPGDLEEFPYVGDKQRLVVPPTLQKEPFYGNSILRRQWSLARDKLARADAIVMIGYSLPMSDLTSRLLLSTCRDGGTVHVVDRDPDAGRRTQDALPGFDVVQVASGESAVRDYVRSLAD